MIDAPVEIHHEAKWPERLNPQMRASADKAERVFWHASSIIALPITLLRLTLHSLGDLAGRQVFPGPKCGQEKLDDLGASVIENFGARKVIIKTPDGKVLDSIYIEGEKHPEKVLLVANGNGSSWETSSKLLSFLHKTGVSILCFNPRGISHSGGKKCVSHFKIDAYSVYDYLYSKGFPHKDILTYGRSLAGGYNLEALALIQEENPDAQINVASERSFDTLSHESYHWMENMKIRFIIPALMRFAGIEIDSVNSYKKLKGKKLVIFHPHDDVIPYSYSLDRAIPDKNDPYLYRIEMQSSGEKDPHNRPFTAHEEQQILETLNTILDIQ